MQKSLRGPIVALVVLGLAAAGLFHQLSQPLSPAEIERAETEKRIEANARKMGMTPAEYLATGKAYNDAVRRYGP